ncbi:MAG: metallophosphoesterase family protein, partial [Planctomycetota bacterium]
MRFLRNFVVLVLVTIVIGCVSIESDLKIHTSEHANPWTHLNLYNHPDNFQFAIVSDRTGEHHPAVFISAIEKLNLLKPEFVMSVGDLIEGYTDDENELNAQWDEFGAIVGKSQMPFFYVPGNHDISNKVMAKRWHQRLGRSFYHFVCRNVLLLCLNTEDTRESFLSNQQIEYFQSVLKNNRNVR